MNRKPLESAVCFFCDYGLVLLAILIVLIVAVFRLTRAPSDTAVIQPVPTAEPIGTTPQATQPGGTEIVSTPVTPVVTPTLTTRPQYILAFVAVNWEGSRASFEREAQAQADFFITKSGIDQFFDVQVVLVETEMSGANLSAEAVLDEMIQFGIQHQPADRYIGLTDGDLAPDGDRWVSGWSYGPDTQGVIVEKGGISITAHELGHTYGLCDEYNYSFWVEQNAGFPLGCPNPYPDSCPKNSNQVMECDGEPASNGDSSIMSGSGMGTDFGFNQASLDHLSNVFTILSGQGATN